MDFTVIAVGRMKEPYFAAAVDEYVKRIGGFGKVKLIDLKDDANQNRLLSAKSQLTHMCFHYA